MFVWTLVHTVHNTTHGEIRDTASDTVEKLTISETNLKSSLSLRFALT